MSPPVGPDTLPGVLAHWARARPDADALRFGVLTWSWARLADRVARLASALRADGVGPGDRVAILDQNHPASLELTLACARLGAVNVAVGFWLPPAEVAYVLGDACVVLLVVGERFEPAVTRLRKTGALPGLRRVVRLGQEYEAWLLAEPDGEVYPAEPDDCFLQLYTSGTTGHPKGVMLTHRGALAHAAGLAAVTGADGDTVLLVAMPLCHVGGVGQALVAVYAGGATVIARAPDPEWLLELLEAERVTHAFFVPALLAQLLSSFGPRLRNLSALRALLYGGTPMSTGLLRDSLRVFPGVLMHGYGMTEAWGFVTLLGAAEHHDQAHPHRLASVGRPIPGVRAQIRDPATGASLPVGETGEIFLYAPQLMIGYWNRPDASAGAIGDDGWFRTGDRGRLDADGYLYLTGRATQIS